MVFVVAIRKRNNVGAVVSITGIANESILRFCGALGVLATRVLVGPRLVVDRRSRESVARGIALSPHGANVNAAPRSSR